MKGSKGRPRLGLGIVIIAGVSLIAVGVIFGGWSGHVERVFAEVADLFTPSVTYTRPPLAATTTEPGAMPTPAPIVEHVALPAQVRAVYMSQCAAASDGFRESFTKLLDETELNAVVVDLKDYSGAVAFPSKIALPGGKGCRVSDFRDLVKYFHDRGVFVIGRLTVFQDPLYTAAHPNEAVQSKKRRDQGLTGYEAAWKDHKGLAFVDVGSEPFHDYIIALAREAHDLGVDEINFDYIRYPSDGDMTDTLFTRTTRPHDEQLEIFFKKMTEAVRADQSDHVPVLSADLFGMTTTNFDDLNIGQVLERALPYFDYIAPMVYPSHYPKGFIGLNDVNAHPYEIVKYSMDRAVERTVATTTEIAGFAYDRIGTSTPALYAKPSYSALKMRPWLQDFDYPVPYTPAMVEAQIKAAYDAGLDSWMFWDPANRYDSLGPALRSKQSGAGGE